MSDGAATILLFGAIGTAWAVLAQLEAKGIIRTKNGYRDDSPREPPPQKPERQKVTVEAVLCEVCKKPYLPKVEHQKYCSAKCRTKANQR